VRIQKVDHSNTRGIVSSLFFSRSEITAALSLHFQHLMKTKLNLVPPSGGGRKGTSALSL
jgi:hypothetical protein